MKKLYRIDTWLSLSLMDKQREELIIKLNVFNFVGNTNHPRDLGKKYYYEYDYSVKIKKDGNYKCHCATASSEIIMTTPNPNYMHDNLEDNIKMIRYKVGYVEDNYLKTECEKI